MVGARLALALQAELKFAPMGLPAMTPQDDTVSLSPDHLAQLAHHLLQLCSSI